GCGRVAERGAERVRAEGVPRDGVEARRRIAHLRFSGQDSVVEVPYVAGRPLRPVFEERYTALFGHRPEGRSTELESIRVIASSRPPAPVQAGGSAATPAGAPGVMPRGASPPVGRRAHLGGRW